jgi:hypothetical protein
LLCTLAFVAMAAVSWRKWPDLLVDFGRELYVPWQLTEGKVLYKDIASLFGPFSQYLNAMWFTFFGVSLTTLIFCNLAILAGTTWLVYRTLADACDRMTASVASLVFLSLFGFAQYATTGNYNYVCPYSHEATHGVALTVAMIFCLSQAGRRPYLMHGLAGLCFGLVLLTRVELSLAAGVVLATWAAMGLLLRGSAGGWPWRPALVLLAAALIPLLGFFFYFWTHMPASQAMRAVGGAYVVLATSSVTDNAFYKTGMGLDDVRGNLIAALKLFAAMAAGAVAIAGLDLLTRKWKQLHAGLAVVLAISTLAMSVSESARSVWMEMARPLPLIAILTWVGVIVVRWRQRNDPAGATKLNPLVLWAAFATVLLGKMILNARIYLYGFFLAAPAVLVLIVCLLWLVPRLLDRRPERGLVFRGVALALILGGVTSYGRLSYFVYSAKTVPVGQDGDLIMAFPPALNPAGPVTAAALKEIDKNMLSGATFVVLPEGVMLNYLARRVNPTPYINFMMIEMLAFGEDTMLASLRQHPPDFVILVHKDTSEFGVGLFGKDERYGQKIMEWVNAEYAPVALFGAEPLQDPQLFGIKVCLRRALASSQPQ